MGKVTLVVQKTAKGRVINDAVSAKIALELGKAASKSDEVKKIMEAKRQKILKEGMGYYSGMLRTLDNILGDPRMGFFEGGGHMAQTRTVMVLGSNGTPEAVTVNIHGEGTWKPLKPSYIVKKPTSTTYWSKEHYPKPNLAKAFADLVGADTMKKSLNAKWKYGRTALKVASKEGDPIAVMHVVVDFPALKGNFFLDRLIRASFAMQKPVPVPVPWGKALSEEYRNQPLNHLLIAEGGPYKRPFVAKFAAQMGKLWMKRLRQLEKGRKA